MYNKGKAEKRWRQEKEREEKKWRELGVDEEVINRLREYDWEVFKSQRRFMERQMLIPACNHIQGHYLQENKPETMEELMDNLENEKLYHMVEKLDKTGQYILLLKMHGFSTAEISEVLNISHKAIYRRMERIRKKTKNIINLRGEKAI